MMIQTLPQPSYSSANRPLVANRTADPRVIVAPEGSNLASQLRSNGWIARAGWRRHAAGRTSIWLVRFECRGDSAGESAA